MMKPVTPAAAVVRRARTSHQRTVDRPATTAPGGEDGSPSGQDG
jgi:hypothetical protein